ncbi:hypothetical protein EPJ90_01295 [Erysipelothrix sp. strain 2 (EsS2-7-Brazil)]|nr:hypothetical protein [Erysipelothrix sp. strain 2 (EsS2-6-Brazil)]MBK2403490.1 hypothetical protein [Erysipelothrix sp. strain 2 (EsS2-7-Brazil)]
MKQALEGYLQILILMLSMCFFLCIVDLNRNQNNLALCKEHVISRMNHFHSIKINTSDLEMCKGTSIQVAQEGERYRIILMKNISLFFIDLPMKLEDFGLTYMIQT